MWRYSSAAAAEESIVQLLHLMIAWQLIVTSRWMKQTWSAYGRRWREGTERCPTACAQRWADTLLSFRPAMCWCKFVEHRRLASFLAASVFSAGFLEHAGIATRTSRWPCTHQSRGARLTAATSDDCCRCDEVSRDCLWLVGIDSWESRWLVGIDSTASMTTPRTGLDRRWLTRSPIAFLKNNPTVLLTEYKSNVHAVALLSPLSK